MNEEQVIELKEFLRDRLSIKVQECGDGWNEPKYIKVSLLLDGEVISEDIC